MEDGQTKMRKRDMIKMTLDKFAAKFAGEPKAPKVQVNADTLVLAAPLTATQSASFGGFEVANFSGLDLVKDFGWNEAKQEFGHFPVDHPLHGKNIF